MNNLRNGFRYCMIETQSFIATTIIISSWLPNNVVNFRFRHLAAGQAAK